MATEPKTEKEVWRRYHIAEAIARKKMANSKPIKNSINLFSLRDYLSAKSRAWAKKERQLEQLKKKYEVD